ncbi:MAG: glycosyltransferase family 39 protein [Lentisphaerae bacterium]|nr:glycosyltransferase family 39 protein [Lentisphaerota bacterium]
MARRTFILLLLGVTAARLWFITSLPLSGDEAYHWEWSRRPAFGYYDHPGLTAYLIRLSTAVFGSETEFAVRFPAVLLLTAAAAAAYACGCRLARRWGAAAPEWAGFAAGLAILAAPVTAAFSIYMSTDPPLLCFWMLTLYFGVCALEDGRGLDWLAAGAALGLAMLSKFLAFLLIPAAGAALLLTPEGRRRLRGPWPYAGALLALVVFAPCLWWNATHGWATFLFNFVYRQADLEPGWRHVPEFLAGQVLAVSPGLFIFGAVAVWRAGRRGTRQGDAVAMWVAAAGALPLLYFLFTSLTRRVGLHWPAVGWMAALPAAAAGERRSPRSRMLWSVSLAAAALLTLAAHGALHVPVRWLAAAGAEGDDNGRFSMEQQKERFGWRELGQRVAETRAEIRDADPGGGEVFILCDQYGLAAATAFYTPGQPVTHLWARRRTHGENYRYWTDFAALEGRNAVYVSKYRGRAIRARHRLRRHFKGLDHLETLPVRVDGIKVREFFLRRCYRFDGRTPDFERP